MEKNWYDTIDERDAVAILITLAPIEERIIIDEDIILDNEINQLMLEEKVNWQI